MLVSAAITHIRNRTGHDVDQQIVDATMLLPWIEQETRRLRRKLSMFVPEMYMSLIGPINIATGASTLNIAATFGSFERFHTVEKRVSGSGVTASAPTDSYAEIPVYVEGSPCLGYWEEKEVLRFMPESLAPGDYRFRYIQGLTNAAFLTTTDLNQVTGSTGGIPQGLEEIIIERVCAIVSTRVPGDDPAPHLKEADRIWVEQAPSLKKRYGRSVRQGFRSVKEYDW